MLYKNFLYVNDLIILIRIWHIFERKIV
jgi:hypothetical protein